MYHFLCRIFWEGKAALENFKIVLNFPVYEGETDPGTLKPKSRYVEVNEATALISVIFHLNYPLCPCLRPEEIYINIYVDTHTRL